MDCEMWEPSSAAVCEKSTTDEEKSEKSSDDEPGMKRKLEEEEEDCEWEDYESEVEESDDDDEPEEDWFEDEVEERILIDGVHFTRERLLRCMYDKDGEKYAYRKTNKFLNKVRRYIKSVCDSGGFDISDWPGNVPGLTQNVPKNYLLEERHIYPEGFNYIMCLADMAIKAYNKDNNDTNYDVKSINTVNASRGQGSTYYITFIASNTEANDERTFQAMVWHNIPGREITVVSCNLKPT